MSKYITGCLVPAVLLILTAALFALLLFGLPESTPEAPPAAVPQVDVVTVDTADVPVQIFATGTVQPTSQVSVVPEVAGRVVWVKPGLRPGSALRSGETFARIDATPYEARVAADRQRVLQAELELSLEEGRQEVSQREFDILRPDGDPENSPLTLRKPQLELARATVEAARAALAQSERDLSRTAIQAPFNAVVLTESLDIGQVVGQTSPVATLAGTDSADVLVDLTMDEVGFLRIPGVTGEEGSPATVVHRVGGQPVQRSGEVVQLLGQLDPQTRRAQVLVQVDDPLVGGMPLPANAFVDVTLTGVTLNDAIRVPSEAVQDGDQVWVVDEEDTLQRRTVDIAWRLPDAVLLSDGLSGGDRVVVSPLSYPVEGQTVSVGGA